MELERLEYKKMPQDELDRISRLLGPPFDTHPLTNEGAEAVFRVTVTAYELRVAKDHELRLWWTPGASAPYWSSQPQWQDDRYLGMWSSFLSTSPYDDLEGVDDDVLLWTDVAAPLPAA
jgi:hypothetical protein